MGWVSTYGRRICRVLLAMVLVLVPVTALPAHAKGVKPDVSVRITSLSPAQFKPGSTITMSGTVTNKNKTAWTDVQAYLVRARSPFTSRAQLDDAVSSSNAYTGERVIDLPSIDMIGDLAPGQSLPFTIKVPYSQLGVSGADGVYPIGVQILGTDSGGNRSNDAIARATTFLPMLSQKPAKKIDASIGWPFLMPVHRGADGNYVDAKKILASVSTGGQLRNLLDLASSSTAGQSTVIVDPALLVAVDDLARGRHLGKKFDPTEAQAAEAAKFRDDLLGLARGGSTWIVDYDRPDLLALAQNRDLASTLRAAVDSSTSAALEHFGLSGRRVSWPTRRGITSGLMEYVRGAGDQPVIVHDEDLKGWERRDGSLLQYETEKGPAPMLVDDAIDDQVPGQDSVVALRQRILSESALAVLLRSIDPSTRADAVALVDPGWDPGSAWSAAKLHVAFQSPWTQGASLDSLLTQTLSSFDGTLPGQAKAAPLSRAQLSAAAEIQSVAESLGSVLAEGDTVKARFDQDTASAVAVRWRRNRAAGLAIAKADAARATKELDKITIEGPQSVTLSSKEGGFPITISNDTTHAISVGVRLESSNPSLSIPDVKATTITAGERHTLTVNMDLGEQGSTSIAAQLISPDGEEFGIPSEFNVRSSAVGIVLWVAIGLAGLLVVVALMRRFARERKDPA